MIQYIVADDKDGEREALHLFLQHKIENQFGAAQGTTYGEVGEVIKAIKEIGSELGLMVLDMNFHGDIQGGGLRILKQLTPQQRRATVVYSAWLDATKMPSNRMLGDEIAADYEIPPDRIIDKLQGSAGLWAACASVLGQSSAF